MFDQAFGFFNNHFSNLYVTRCRFVEGRRDDFAAHRALHIGHFFGAFVDQQNDQVAVRMVGRDRLGDVLQHHRLTDARRRHDQTTLAFAERGHDIDDTARAVLQRWVVDLHPQTLIRIERRQVVEVDLVTDVFRVFEIDRLNLEQGEIPFAFARAADRTFDRIPSTQAMTANLLRADIDIVRARKIVGFGAAQEAKAVLQNFHNA